ncbi:MAG: hypothetical protein IPG32_11880 [Saprospirales bacterium]|jgi:hypothetical protein|nr:hypothetical protein [Saprospirales bacterium]
MLIQIIHEDRDREMHKCESKREGDWIVFTCPICLEYESRLNFKTKERISRPVNDPSIFHNGTFVPPGLDVEGSKPN